MKRAIFLIAPVFILAAIGAWWYLENRNEVVVTNFEECVKAGNPVSESYPRQCRDGEKVFTEEVGNVVEKSNLIRLETPRPNEEVTSPLVITGEARGYWFFEASFPVFLTDWDGLIIAQGIATAQVDPADGGAGWMTEDFVPFEATLTFAISDDIYSRRGALILKKDNPSGLPENDDALEIPIFYKETNSGGAGILPYTSGVGGLVLLGPTCPVVREGDTSCADKPYKTIVQAIRSSIGKSSVFASAETDVNGRYKLSLPPGDYTLQPVGGKTLPTCGSTDVSIDPNKTIEVNLFCDTGIR